MRGSRALALNQLTVSLSNSEAATMLTVRMTNSECCLRRISVTLASSWRDHFLHGHRYASQCCATLPRNRPSYACGQRSDEPAPSPHPRSCRSSVRSDGPPVAPFFGARDVAKQRTVYAFDVRVILRLLHQNGARMQKLEGHEVSCECARPTR